jgi:hypothetical protein
MINPQIRREVFHLFPVGVLVRKPIDGGNGVTGAGWRVFDFRSILAALARTATD